MELKMNISLTRVMLECLIAYYLNGYLVAKKVLIHYIDRVSVKNGKTLKMIVERLNVSDEEKQKEYFYNLSKTLSPNDNLNHL